MKEITRNYNFSDAELVTECTRVESCVERDMKDFAARKITPDYLKGFSDTALSFSDFPTDDEMQGDVTTATENKDGVADLIRRKVRVVRSMAEEKWGRTGRYKTFGFEGMSVMTDSDLLVLVKRVVRVGNRFLSDLESEGLTTEILAELTDLGTQFSNAMDLQKAAMNDRDIESQERVILGNSVYTMLVKLTNIGKSLYEDTNEAKYNDYVLYPEKDKAESEPKTA